MKKKTIFKEKIFHFDEISKLRDYFNGKTFFNKSLNFSEFDKNDILIKHILSKKIIDFLKLNLMEDIIFIGNFVIQKNNRTNKEEKYHKDSGKKHQSKIISKEKNLYGKVGIMLQDNIKGEGGGIDFLKPLLFDNFSDENFFLNKVRAIYYYIQNKLTDTHFLTKKGDVIFFSAMLSHRSSKTNFEKMKFIEDKYVIYTQITNSSLIKDVLEIVEKKKINNFIIEDYVDFFFINDEKIKILKQKFVNKITQYVGA